MPSARIRKAKLEDAHSIAVIHVESWRAAYRGLLPQKILDDLSVERREEFWRETLVDPKTEERVWLAEADGSVVGFAFTGMNRDEEMRDERTPELFAIYLAPGTWGRGVGRALQLQALDDLAERGFDTVVLWVLESNERTIRFYEVSGWKPDGAREFLDGLDAHKVRYRRSLL